MPTPEYSTWISKQQAADAIGVSTKTIEQVTKDGKLQQAYSKSPKTGAKVSVYHPGDVERLRKERNPEAQPFVLPQEVDRSESKALAVLPTLLPTSLEQILQAIVGISQNSEKRSEVPRLLDRIYLTVPEAASLSGLPQAYLRRLMSDGKLEALKTGAGWRIRRADLDKL